MQWSGGEGSGLWNGLRLTEDQCTFLAEAYSEGQWSEKIADSLFRGLTLCCAEPKQYEMLKCKTAILCFGCNWVKTCVSLNIGLLYGENKKMYSEKQRFLFPFILFLFIEMKQKNRLSKKCHVFFY